MKKTKRRPVASIPILIYLLTVAGWLLFSTATVYSDRKAQREGTMPEVTADQSDFALLNVLKANDKLVCISTDPQMWWYNYDNIRVRTLTMTATYSKDPLEVCLFYLREGEDNFSLDQRVYPVENEDGTYTFTLPVTDVTKLRLDICSDTCVIRDFAVKINAPRETWRYYVPSTWYLFLMLILPGLAASAVSILHNNIVLYLRHGGPLSVDEIRAAVDQEDDDIPLDALEADETTADSGTQELPAAPKDKTEQPGADTPTHPEEQK